MTDKPRLIEFAFPLQQASLDSVHEKNVRHGHISTLHIWPARRPLAACRAALIATLLPDPSAEPKPEEMSDEAWQEEIKRRRRELCEKIGGKVVKRIEKKKMPGGQIVEREKDETEGGILHWGRETENAETFQWFRDEICKVYDGRAPKVLDPFAGGGAIPLEAMRLGCHVTAIDINPVAWFILKCTLEHPQKLAGQKQPLPAFILRNREFMEAYLKAQGLTKAAIRTWLSRLADGSSDVQKSLSEDADLQYDIGDDDKEILEANLAWHVRAWGLWVLERARRELATFYPVYADFEPVEKDKKSYERQSMQFVSLKGDGTADIEALNGEFGADYLAVKSNPRWIAKPTIAYLWARTVTCKNCRAKVPLLKTRWLCKKHEKRVLLRMTPNAESSTLVFGVEENVPIVGGNAAQRREHDRAISSGTMSKAGAKCPYCPTISTSEDIRLEGRAGRLGHIITAVVVDGPKGKEYRLPTPHECTVNDEALRHIPKIFEALPFGEPSECIPEGGSRAGGGSPFTVVTYGLTRWRDLFTSRQLVAHGTVLSVLRESRKLMKDHNMPEPWLEGCQGALALTMGKVLDYGNTLCSWYTQNQQITHLFNRFALPMKWDFAETSPIGGASGSWESMLGSVARSLETCDALPTNMLPPSVERMSAIQLGGEGVDLILTDPPYYDAIPYSDLMDFFYVWHRRILSDLGPSYESAMHERQGPKWDNEANDGELIDDASRHGGNLGESKRVYEDGMFRVFLRCWNVLKMSGRLVIVFANKQPDAWETLVSAIIRAGFAVDGSWPIQTEMSNRTRSHSSAALASSVWLVCKKRDEAAKLGWDNIVLEDMRTNIGERLRDFWDAGIRGPDFVWAATGPALEAYSKHPVVKMADNPGQTLTVAEFLNHARRMVVDFVVGRVLGGDESDAVDASFDRLDELTAYYLLHRNDFGLDDAPVGACILYATACGLSDQELVRDWDLLAKTGRDDSFEDVNSDEESQGDEEPAEEASSGSKLKLKAWNQRRGRSLGIEAPSGRPVPLIDRIHRLMHLWKAGDAHKVDEFVDEHGLRQHELFRRVLQSLIELADQGSQERALLESLSNHVGAKGAKKKDPQRALALDVE